MFERWYWICEKVYVSMNFILDLKGGFWYDYR